MIQAFTIRDDDHDIRLDRWFKRYYPNITQGELQKAIRKGLIRLDGKKLKATSDHVTAGAALEVKYLDLASEREAGRKPEPRRMELSKDQIKETRSWVIYQDEHVIAINKPAGLASQGGSKLTDHLDARLAALQFDKPEPPKLVHRLDKDTSGVLLLGRSAQAASKLAKAFAQKRCEKRYWAIIVGVPDMYEGEIDGAIIKSNTAMEKMMVDPEGKRAITAYRVIEAMAKKLAWVELMPITGRTHQLRVHMAEMGNPILGDGKYGGQEAFISGMALSKKLHLHARELVLPDWYGKTLRLTAPLPPHMQQSFRELGLNA